MVNEAAGIGGKFLGAAIFRKVNDSTQLRLETSAGQFVDVICENATVYRPVPPPRPGTRRDCISNEPTLYQQ